MRTGCWPHVFCTVAICSVARAAPAEVTVEGDGVSATFMTDTGALLALEEGGRTIRLAAGGGRLTVQDFPSGRQEEMPGQFAGYDSWPRPLRGGSRPASDAREFDFGSRQAQQMAVTSAYEGAGLTCELTWRMAGGMLRGDGLLRNLRGGDRAVVLTYELPLAGGRLRFSPSLNAMIPMERGASSATVYPLAAMCGEDFGLALGIPPTAPCTFRMVGSPGGPAVRIHLGLNHETRSFPDAAKFLLLVYPCDPAWGFRDALRRYYAAFPEFYKHHGRGDGLWLFNTADPQNISDYFYDEVIGQGRLRETLRRDHAAGVLTFAYMIVGQREIKHLATLPADYDAAMEAYRAWTPPGQPVARQTKESVAAGDERYLKEEVASSALRGPDGQYVITVRNTTWGRNSVTFVMNPNPALLADRTGMRTTGGEAMARIREWLKEYRETDGIYIDSLGSMWCAKLNFRRDHFPYARYPLTFDSAGRVALHNAVSHYELLEDLRAELHGAGRLLFANGIYPYSAKQPEYADVRHTGRFFLAALLDVAGSESGVQPSMERWEFFRACMGPKPYLLLNYWWTDAAKVETYLHQALCYDVFATNSNLAGDYSKDPQGYARDRKLYDWFVPLARMLSKAGWRPVTHATSPTPGLLFERHGEGREVFFTMHNRGQAGECVLQARKGPLKLGRDCQVEQVSGPGLAGVEQDAERIEVRTNLPVNRTAVIRVLGR